MYTPDELNFIFQQSQTHMKYGIWKSNAELDELYISKELCSILHIDYEEQYDLTVIEDIVYIEDIAKMYALFEDAATLGIGFDTTFRSEVNGELNYFSIYCDVKFGGDAIEYLYGFIQDITTASIENDKKERLSHLTNNHIIISQVDLNDNITYVSQAYVNKSGYSVSELIGKNQSIVRHPEMPSSIFSDIWTTIMRSEEWEGELLQLSSDTINYWVHAYISPLLDYQNNVIGYQTIEQDITDKKKIEEIAITDALTSVYNRRHFNTVFPKEINYSRRTDRKIVFVMLDVDNFKKYNDRYGHHQGDKVLIDIASSLTQSFRRSHDMVFRLGGEEFGIIFTLNESDNAYDLVDNARQNIEDMQIEHIDNNAGVVTASFGVVGLKSNLENEIYMEVKNIYKEADDLLYKAKGSGRNRVCI